MHGDVIRTFADLTSLQERKPTAKALAKCRDNEFYLGIVANWTATKVNSA